MKGARIFYISRLSGSYGDITELINLFSDDEGLPVEVAVTYLGAVLENSILKCFAADVTDEEIDLWIKLKMLTTGGDFT